MEQPFTTHKDDLPAEFGHTSPTRNLAWWRELAIVAVVYVFYETIRNITQSTPKRAYANAVRLINLEKNLGIFQEQAMQDWAVQFAPLIIVSNYFYGAAYIVVTVAGLVYLFRRFPDDYRFWRNALLALTLLALVGFALFPLMPPRLLDVRGDGRVWGFVDTLVKYPTFWSFQSSAMEKVSNQFAAMPSLHCAWSIWAMTVFYPRVRTRWARFLSVGYAVFTTYVIIITGNHYFLDAVGGLVVFLLGVGIARVGEQLRARSRAEGRTRQVQPAVELEQA
ncbi:MAG: phosphatase PAP2 family protein [Acidimicrobiales bacterium]|nr:phosphatase PAP2 family protein [Acidimicrobiales bacterium]